MADCRRPEVSLVCVGNLSIDEARYHARPAAPALGGDAAYAALAARLFLADVTMLAPVGHDVPRSLLDAVAAAGVNARDLPERDLPTLRNVIHYHRDGSRTWEMVSSEQDFDLLSVYPTDIPAAALRADGLLLSAMSLESQLSLTPWLREHSAATLYLDLQEDYLYGNEEALRTMIGCCDVFLPSEIEATALAGTADMEAAARVLGSWGPRTVVIKRAEHGSILLEGDNVMTVPSTAVEPVDSTGAGDAFCGAFAAVHLVTRDAVCAARAGARAARLAIGSFGIDGVAAAARRVHESGRVLLPGGEAVQ